MLLERLVKRLPLVGAGAYMSTYDMLDGRVMKILKRVTYPQDPGKGPMFAPVKTRIRVANELKEHTDWLAAQMGDVIVPIEVGPGGVIYQEKLEGRDFYDVTYMSDTSEHRRKLETLRAQVRGLVELAERIVTRERPGLPLDHSACNFMINDYKVVGWFDPFTPTRAATLWMR